MINTILSTQKMRSIGHACRLQFTGLAQFQVRPLKDWEVIKEEFIAAIEPKVLEEMYQLAISDPYGFLFLNLKGGRYFRSFKSELKAS
mgnify:CR=1 FL=1